MARKRTRRERGASAGHQAGPGTVVSLAYELADAEGECIERSEPGEPLELLLGFGIAPESLERAIAGLAVGASREVVLPPEEGFGSRDPEAVIEVDRADLPEVAPGDELDADREDGSGPVFLKVLDVRDDVVVLDANHPLAGQKARLRVRLEAVRPATEEEMDAATAALENAAAGAEGAGGTAAGSPSPAGSEGPLLPVERLLKRGREQADPPPDGDGPPAPPRKRAALA